MAIPHPTAYLLATLPPATPPAVGEAAPPTAAVVSEQERTVQVKALFEQHADFVWRSLRRMGVPDADLEDATQEVFMVVYRRWGEYQERARVRGWLHAICLRFTRSHRRRVARRRENILAELPEEPVAASQQHRLEQREALALGRELLAALPPKQRDVFLLYEVEQMTMTEIAEAVNCPLQTAYARLRKARERVWVEVRRAQRVRRLP